MIDWTVRICANEGKSVRVRDMGGFKTKRDAYSHAMGIRAGNPGGYLGRLRDKHGFIVFAK